MCSRLGIKPAGFLGVTCDRSVYGVHMWCRSPEHAGEDHWSFRMATAQCLSNLAERFPAPELQVRARVAGVCQKVLDQVPSDRAASRHLAGCFGAAAGLQAMGMQLVCMMLIPALPTVMRMLQPCINRVCFQVQNAAACLDVSAVLHGHNVLP